MTRLHLPRKLINTSRTFKSDNATFNPISAEHKAYNQSTFFMRQISLGKHTAPSAETDENMANTSLKQAFSNILHRLKHNRWASYGRPSTSSWISCWKVSYSQFKWPKNTKCHTLQTHIKTTTNYKIRQNITGKNSIRRKLIHYVTKNNAPKPNTESAGRYFYRDNLVKLLKWYRTPSLKM